ncbi:hypothetical protein D9615_003970 [Tricholomella constricta]|uniref:Protein transport protein sec16 n=1 Tax=Tricholomella constricta TaxID=117010 RepID=A0A8H5M4V0_9AGAR|nr:hypothetical protein D9615_003970 [Tricholomella constricta]
MMSIVESDAHLEYLVKVSYMEIYLERIRDLLAPQNDNLQVHEEKSKGVYVKNLSDYYVSSAREVYEIMRTGGAARVISSTNMNAESSRSHSIFLITIQQRNTETGALKTGNLYLVDLAGSEKVGKTGASGQTLEEAKKINKSLSALGMVINALTDSKAKHIPYRDSKLTRILQESLGGNSRTTLIINCSPSSYNEAETLSTLRFGIRAKSIKNTARVNAELSPLELKGLLAKANLANTGYQKYIAALEAELVIWRAGGHVEQSEWATSAKAASAPSAAAPKKPPTSPTPSTPLPSSRSMTPVNPAIESLRGDLDSRPQTPTVIGLDKDEREDFLKRENELSDQLAERESALLAADKLVKELREELTFLKEQEASVNKENKAMSSQLNELRLQVERLDYDNKEGSITIDILKEQNQDAKGELEELKKQIAELKTAQKDATAEDKEKRKQEKMAMMMAKFDTQGAFSEKDEQLRQILAKLDSIDGAGALTPEDLTAIRRQLSEGQSLVRETVDRLRQSQEENEMVTRRRDELEARVAALETEYEELLEKTIHDEETSDVDLAESMADLKNKLEAQYAAKRDAHLSEAGDLKQQLEMKANEVRSLNASIDSLKSVNEELKRAFAVTSAGIEGGKNLAESAQDLERTRKAINVQLAEFDGVKKSLMRDLQNRCEKVVELEIQLDEIKEQYNNVIRNSNSKAQQKKMAFLERNLEQLTLVQKQNSSLKKEAGIAERKLLARNERIQNLEALLQDADRRLSIQNQKFEAQLQAVKERLDQARAQKATTASPLTFGRIAKPLRGGGGAVPPAGPMPAAIGGGVGSANPLTRLQSEEGGETCVVVLQLASQWHNFTEEALRHEAGTFWGAQQGQTRLSPTWCAIDRAETRENKKCGYCGEFIASVRTVTAAGSAPSVCPVPINIGLPLSFPIPVLYTSAKIRASLLRMSGNSSRKPSGSSTHSAAHSPLSSPSHGQPQRSLNPSAAANMYGIGVGSTNGRKGLNSGWQVWGSAAPSSRNASVSSATSGNDLQTDASYRPNYNEGWSGPASRSTSGNWDEANDVQQKKEMSSMDANVQLGLHHTRPLTRQTTVTQAVFSAPRMSHLRAQEDRSGGPKGGQYSPQRYDNSIGKDNGARFPSAPSPTRPFPASSYPGAQNANGLVGQYDTLQVPSEEISLALRGMAVEDDLHTHQNLPAPPSPHSCIPPLQQLQPRQFNGYPPPEYNPYYATPPREPYVDYHQYGYGPTDPSVYGSPAMNNTSSAGLYPGMPTPQVPHPSGVPVPDMHRAQPGIFYEYGANRPPSQYYFPTPQPVMYSQPPPPPNHSPMVTSQIPATLMDKKRELQYNIHQQLASQTLMYSAIRSTPSPHRQGYIDYTQFPFIIPGPLGLYNHHPAHMYLPNMRGGRRGHSTDDGAVALRSPILDEFRGNKARKWELRDIFGHIVEFSGDQHGSRFIQQKLESATTEEKQAVFDEIVPSNTLQLIQDVIQKLFEHGTQVQKTRLAQTMEGHILFLSSQMYGCRVVQKAVEYVLPDQQAIFVRELEPHVLKCVKDPNGNHVIQKLIERVSPDRLGFVHIFRGNVYDLATHPYGCRVLQRCLEHLPEENTRPLMEELHKYSTTLMQDQFGNYVVQYILEHGKPRDRALVISKLHGQILMMARHKFASNVCEKALMCADAESRRKLVDEIITLKPDGVSPITSMMKDQFANYVLQRAMIVAVGEQKETLFNKVKPQLRHQMNGVEAAASLFGSDEPASDPFASLGADTAPQSSADDLFSGDGASNDSDFLNTSPDHGPFAAEDNTAQDTSQFYIQSDLNSGYSTAGTYTHLGAGRSQQGWYDQQGQWQSLEQQQSVEPNLSTPALEHHNSQQLSNTASNPYEPYAPTSNTYAPPINTPALAQPPYNPYTPSQPMSNYLPSQPAAPTNSTYTPYAYAPPNSLQGAVSQYTPSYASGSQAPYAAAPIEHVSPPKPSSSVLVPPPVPAPTSTITRPKISNAYDPPFPTTTKANRRGARTGSGQQPYGYNTYEAMSPPVPAYVSSSQTSPYISQTPPPPQVTPPPPQRPAPPPSPPAQPRFSSQSLPPPPARSPALPVQPSYNSSGSHAFRNEIGVGEAGVPFHGNGISNTSFAESKPSDDERWTHQPYGTEPVSPPGAVTDTPLENADPEASFADFAMEGSIGFDSHSVAQTEIEDLQPPLSSPAVPGTGSPLSLVTTLRADSPHQQTLPPSPTLSQQQGRSSPFLDSSLISSKRTASPRSFVEPPRERTPDVDPYVPQRDTNHSANARLPQQMISSPLRSSSPASIANGVRSPPTGAINPYLPKSVVSGERAASPAHSLNGHAGVASDPYAPKAHVNAYRGERTTSPGSFRSVTGGPPAPKNYPLANFHAPPRADTLRNRSMSNSSMLSSTSTSQEDPYAPSHHTKRIPSEIEYGSYSSRYNYPNGQDATHHTHSALQPEYSAQEVPMKSLQTPYAPSPSLLGANDPLGRTSSRVPIFSFGFGGKLVTCFHGADSLSTGFDVALSSRNSTGIHIRVLKTLIPESALDTSTSSFPGPLFGDSGTSTTSLVRTGANTQVKTKKAKVIKYLSERTDELALGLRYLRPDSIDSRQAEGKLVLVKLLQLMVEYDGRLTGSSELDTAVRLALVPRLEGTFGANGFSTVADTQGPVLPGFSTESQESAISVTALRASTLDKIQDFLLRGERRQAYHYALDEKLWAHAMVIASSIDKDSWKEVVSEFLRTELGANPTLQSPGNPSTTPLTGRESLRAAYSLFSGQGAAAVQELVPQNLLARANGRLQPQLASHLTPRTPNFAVLPAQAASIPAETLSKWAETVAMMLSNPLSPETSAALTAMGDHLAANQLFEAAHIPISYLLAPQTSPWGGLAHPSARFVLVGSRNPQTYPQFAKDQDPMIFSEIAEFALSLATPPKGQDAFSGITHLQAYRFIRAMSLAEIGDIQQANRYCDAVTAAVVRSSPYATPALLEQLKGLSDRIAGVTQVDKSFWTGAKLSKPSLDTIGGWLEGRFTKLVTGDADMEKMPEEEVSKPDNGGFSGPFSHYSTISSATPSARSSPQPSVVNLNVLPPARSGSAMASSSPYAHPQIDRASSAMDHVRRKPSPGPRIASANASTTSFTSAPSFGQALSSQRLHNGYSPSDDLVTPRPSLANDYDENAAQEATWWGGTGYAEGPATQTPTASTFMHVDETALPASASSDGFISLMDNASYSVGSQPSARTMSQASSQLDEEDEEDLGFGNSKREKRELPTGENGHSKSSPSPEPAKPATPPQPGNKPAPATGGWLSRWWKKNDASPGPVKASLGEESAFYYDKDLKRWVNKKAGAEAPKPATPPPVPSRAQTASPAMTGPRPPAASEAGPPPNRSASAIDLSTSPPSRTVMRVRSNLVPTPESAPSTPTGTRLVPPGPPPGRPKSQASKRNIRSRYVDVFQQEGGAA